MPTYFSPSFRRRRREDRPAQRRRGEFNEATLLPMQKYPHTSRPLSAAGEERADQRSAVGVSLMKRHYCQCKNTRMLPALFPPQAKRGSTTPMAIGGSRGESNKAIKAPFYFLISLCRQNISFYGLIYRNLLLKY